MSSDPDPTALAARVLRAGPALFAGAPGTGKSTLCEQVADQVEASGQRCFVLSADPGQSHFGPPTCVTLAERRSGQWLVVRFESIATLDAGRFRLPFIEAVRSAIEGDALPCLLIDAPGVARGWLAQEVLHALVNAVRAKTVFALHRSQAGEPVRDLLQGLEVDVMPVIAAAEARPLSHEARVERRTLRWRHWLRSAGLLKLPLHNMPVLGMPPSTHRPELWKGLVVGILGAGARTLSIGEVLALDSDHMLLRALPFEPSLAVALVARNARVAPATGLLTTMDDLRDQPAQEARSALKRGAFTLRRVPDVRVPLEQHHVGRKASLIPTLVNGLFGDPLVHLRLLHERRSLLVDLGDASALPTRIAHQTTDVCVTHAHLDHFCGFSWLLRMRVGMTESCRLFGPPRLAQRVEAHAQAFTWNLVGERGPRFVVTELEGPRVRRFEVRAGSQGPSPLGDDVVEDGVLHEEAGFRLRAVELDHNGTPVLAFAFEEVRHFSVRADRLAYHGWSPGAWLGRLKRLAAAGDEDARVDVPGHGELRSGDLIADLLLCSEGQRLVYASDVADTPVNRNRLIDFARGADLFLCEAAFVEQDAERARATGHLTARACGEIASAAEVRRLVPFHFSARYELHPEVVYQQVLAACENTLVPPGISDGQVELTPGRRT